MRQHLSATALSPFATAHSFAPLRSLRNYGATRRGMLLIFLLFLVHGAFAQHVISPVEGSFANKQSLVLSLQEGEEAYYSLSDTNPLNSGFAYDGPVLIDVSGTVSLRIVVVSGNKKEQYEISYTCEEEKNPFQSGTQEKVFLDRVLNERILLCTGENIISIPPSLSFSIGDGEKPFLQGTTLTVSADNSLTRYIPCNLTDGTSTWRFIIHLSSLKAGGFSKKSVPFQISDWENFQFSGKNLIWCIDNGLWSASKEPVRIDRTKTHVLYWQDVAYKEENPIQSFVLPQKPSIQKSNHGKEVIFAIDGDLRYKMAVKSNGAEGDSHEPSGLYTVFTFDAFDGDNIVSTAIFDFYCDGVYQGNIAVPYRIDRQPPLPPKFIASESGSYARKEVLLKIESEKDSQIYISISGPHTLNSNSYLDGNSELDYIKAENYFLYNSQAIELRPGIEKTVGYKVFAYAKDFSGNTSEISTYKVIIDEYNYFLDGNASDFSADGSRLHPYNSFEQVLKVINSGKFVHFFVSGTVHLPAGIALITSNCSFTGMSDAKFVLPPSSYISVQDASLEMQNCVIQKELNSSSDSDQRLFVFDKSAAIFEDCELSSNFSSSGTAISSTASIVTLKNSGVTVQASTYACPISGMNSRFSITDSHFASIADTAVNFSVKGGSFELINSACKVISHLGRILEASGVNLKLNANKFIGEFDREQKNSNYIWKDSKSLVIEDRNNTSEGF